MKTIQLYAAFVAIVFTAGLLFFLTYKDEKYSVKLNVSAIGNVCKIDILNIRKAEVLDMPDGLCFKYLKRDLHSGKDFSFSGLAKLSFSNGESTTIFMTVYTEENLLLLSDESQGFDPVFYFYCQVDSELICKILAIVNE